MHRTFRRFLLQAALNNTANGDDLAYLKDLLEAGKVVPVIDKSFPLSDLPKALRYYGEGHSQGKVVITVG